MTKRPRLRRENAKRSAAPKSASRLRSNDFRALSDFAKGYLHEDFIEEHGTALDAVTAFARAATANERAQLAKELASLIDRARGLPFSTLRTFVTRDLGSGWQPRATTDFTDMLNVLERAT